MQGLKDKDALEKEAQLWNEIKKTLSKKTMQKCHK